MEYGDLSSIDLAIDTGFPILRRIARNATERRIQHQVVFGFSYRTAPQLLEFLKKHRAEIRNLTGVRYSAEAGHPFHVVDERILILPLDHPFILRWQPDVKIDAEEVVGGKAFEGSAVMFGAVMSSLDDLSARPRIDAQTLRGMALVHGHGAFVERPPGPHLFHQNREGGLL